MPDVHCPSNPAKQQLIQAVMVYSAELAYY